MESNGSESNAKEPNVMDSNAMEPNAMELVLRDVQEQRKAFDEEADERDEFRIQQLLLEFEDEPPIQHDEMPESDSDQDEEVRERARTHIRRGDGSLYKKQKFISGVAFKETVVDYALRTGRNLWQYRYDKLKLGFKCAGGNVAEGKGCKWQVYASLLPKNSHWKVSKFIDEHSCIPNGECQLLREPVITRLFMDKIREEPDYYMPKKIEELIREKWGITVTRHQCQNARGTALKWIDHEYDQQFARLKDYAAEILVANPGSSVQVDTIQNEAGQDLFNRFYVCLDVLRTTWKQSCRPLIGVDGTFMKHKIKGQLLVALGRDADNAIYPIAWAAVQVENTDNWHWFLKKLKIDLELEEGDGYIMISDRQKVIELSHFGFSILYGLGFSN